MTALHSTRRARAYGGASGRASGEFCFFKAVLMRVGAAGPLFHPPLPLALTTATTTTTGAPRSSSSSSCLGRTAYLALTAASNVAMWLLIFGLCALLLLFFALALPTGAGKAAVGGAIE
jgi:hypothetical protein